MWQLLSILLFSSFSGVRCLFRAVVLLLVFMHVRVNPPFASSSWRLVKRVNTEYVESIAVYFTG